MFITSKGQVTIPAEIRRKAGLHPHTEVEFVVDGGRVLLQAKPGGKSRGDRVVERLASYRGKFTMSTEEIMALTRGED